ncbi:MAG TPA: transporter [Vicinamibacteria bacterium]|nr:transporter [Vicinamibacteria bacterium]
MPSVRTTWTWQALVALGLLASFTVQVQAQTIEDGVMMPGKNLCTGFLYAHDSWDEYWEGTLKRVNGNIGTITTESLSWVGNYGVTNRLNVIAMLPHVWTEASQGPLHGMSGFQDLTLAAKYSLLETDFTRRGALKAILVAAASVPLGDYTPDFYPLSIGSASRRFASRLTVDFQAQRGWFLTGSAAYTFRDTVTLDRPAYFTDGQLFLSDQVAMPDVFDYTVSAGYRKEGLMIPVAFSQQTTLGGGDIRRQDMPFVSNRMDFSKLDALVMYTIPKAKDLALRVAGTYTVSGRNVGQATTLTAGLLYTFHF